MPLASVLQYFLIKLVEMVYLRTGMSLLLLACIKTKVLRLMLITTVDLVLWVHSRNCILASCIMTLIPLARNSSCVPQHNQALEKATVLRIIVVSWNSLPNVVSTLIMDVSCYLSIWKRLMIKSIEICYGMLWSRS